jgi:Na+/H+-dicarboxylate symporter
MSTTIKYIISIAIGFIAALFGGEWAFDVAGYVSDIFMNLLKLVSIPILFLSIVSVTSGMDDRASMAKIGKKIIGYTFLTTVIAATVALFLFLAIDPSSIDPSSAASKLVSTSEWSVEDSQGGYWKHILALVPSNLVTPFIESNAIGVLLIAFLLSGAIFMLPADQKKTVHNVFSAFYALFMKVTSLVVMAIPVALAAFIVLFCREVQQGLDVTTIGRYLGTVIGANLIQGFIILPLLLKLKGISPILLARAMMPALTLAFFTKSSSATVPTAVECAQKRAGMRAHVASFSFPLCTTINMNGCAAFILITVLFVSQLHGMQFSSVDYASWVFMATLAAVGNAGVPMGCFFLASAFLAMMNVPLVVMGVILPFYALVDAIETALNVWSDSCVAAVTDKELLLSEQKINPSFINS